MSTVDDDALVLSSEQRNHLLSALSWVQDLEYAESADGFPLVAWSRALPQDAVETLVEAVRRERA